MVQYSVTTGVLGLVLAFAIFYLVRKDLLHTRYSLLWLGIAVISMVAGLFPKMFDLLARALGITYPPTLFLLLAIIFLLVKTLQMDIERTKQKIQLRRLAQRLAILEGSLRDEG